MKKKKNSTETKLVKTVSNNSRKKESLKEKFKKYKGKNLAKEFAWDDPVGKEY